MKKLVTLQSFSNPFEAEVVKGRLEADGVVAYLIHQNLNYSIGTTFLQQYKLQVEQKDLLKAINIYKKIGDNDNYL